MRYFKKTVENGEYILLTFGFDPVISDTCVEEITEEEYNTLQAELAAEWEEEENPPVEETGETATEADYIAALQELGVEI